MCSNESVVEPEFTGAAFNGAIHDDITDQPGRIEPEALILSSNQSKPPPVSMRHPSQMYCM